MTLEQLQRALSIVAHIDDEAFEQRAPLLFKYITRVRVYSNIQEVAYEHSALLHEYLYNKAMQDEVVALVS